MKIPYTDWMPQNTCETRLEPGAREGIGMSYSCTDFHNEAQQSI